MSAPFRPYRKPGNSFKPGMPIFPDWHRYEQLKAELTAGARTSAEYDAAIREAARRAGV